MKIFTGNANPYLTGEIAGFLGMYLANSEVFRFSDGEVGVDVFVIQSTCSPINDNLMELLIMIDACRRASAGRINAVIPYFGYGRQDCKNRARDPITAKLISNLIMEADADRLVAIDLHAAQIQGFLDIPVDELTGVPTLAEYITRKNLGDRAVVVSPDMAGVPRARNLAARLL